MTVRSTLKKETQAPIHFTFSISSVKYTAGKAKMPGLIPCFELFYLGLGNHVPVI